MNDCVLNFANYCWQGDETKVPNVPGIYCVYACTQNGARQIVDGLLYIGKSLRLQDRLSRHTRERDLNQDPSKSLFYAYAELDGRKIDACEAAMIVHFRPPLNSVNTVSLGAHGDTRVTIEGAWAFRIRGTFVEQVQ